MATIRTTCAYCGVGCGISAEVTGTRSVSITGDRDHPANRGKLCSKGMHLGETVGLEGRLLHPMIGGVQASWDEALSELARRMQTTIDEFGPDSVAFYVSGQLLTEDYYVANKLMKGFIGSGNIDTNSRLCMASAVAAHNRAFGEDVVPCTYDDLDEAELILLVGSNTAWCHPVIWQRIEQARERRGTKLVVIDPRRTETAELADLHIALEPDGDIALFNALLAEMDIRGLVDHETLAANADAPEDFWAGLSHESGIDCASFAQLADWVAAHPQMVTLFSQGANQSVCGTDKGNSIINLHLALGRINAPGMGPFSITGQPNAMGGREVGGLANTLACHLGFSQAERDDAARFWQAPNICSGPGLKAVDLFRAVHAGKVKFLWVMATNPAVSMPDAGFVREALERCPTVVVSDVIAETDTGQFADIRLPALAWGEKDGTVTNSERMISRQRALFAPPEEARADWQIVCDVAARLGWGEHFAFDGPAAIFREYAAMTALSGQHGKLLYLTAQADCSDADYETLEPFRWGGEHPFASGYSTQSGKAQLVSIAPATARAASAEFPLRLNTGRYRDQWHTMTRTGLSPTLSQHRREPVVELSPEDAGRHGIGEGELVRVQTPYGKTIYRAALRDEQPIGAIFVPMHWTDRWSNAGRTGRLAQPLHDPHSGQPGFKDTPAAISKVKVDWRAFMVSREVVEPDALYWTRSKVPGGWLMEIAGEGSIDCDALLPPGLQSQVSDMARGMRRIIVTDDSGALEAALFVTRTGTLPSRDWICAQLSEESPLAAELLAGRPAVPQPDAGPIVCVCHGVGEQQILAAISGGAGNVAAVGACTKAGTNCGSCRPAIARLLAEALEDDREAAE